MKNLLRNKRASVYELLYGKDLAKVLQAVKGKELKKHSYRTLKNEIGKAVALGFVENKEYERLVNRDD